MKRTFNQYIMLAVIIISSIFVTSCEKEIELDLKFAGPIVVIEGRVQENELPKVKVSMTKDYYGDNNFPAVEGAIVTVIDDDGNSDVLSLDNSGWYVGSKIRGKVGRTYNLSVKYEGREYTSTSKMPPLVHVDSLTFFKFPVYDYAFPMVHFLDPVGKENEAYRFVLYVNGKRPRMSEVVRSDQFIDGTYIRRLIPVFPINNDADDPILIGDNIKVEFQCIDHGAFKFFETLSDIDNSQANPTTNIKGGALGYFSAYTAETIEGIAEWD